MPVPPAAVWDALSNAGGYGYWVVGSKVIRDAYGVSDDMRSRVQAAINELGYRPRAAARAMRDHLETAYRSTVAVLDGPGLN